MNKNLVELKDLMIYPFYICLTKEYREYLIKKALDKKKDFKTLAKEVRCGPYTLRHFKDYKEKYIKAKFLKNLLNLLNISIHETEKHVLSVKRGCGGGKVKIKLPIKASPELSLLIAKCCGDGSVLSDWRFHYTNNQINLIEEVINAVEKSIGGIRYTLHERIRSNNKVFEIKFSPVVGSILYFLGAPKGYKLNQEYYIPSWIINGNLEVKSAFLRGLFDDESTVDFREATKRITISIGKKQLYEENLKHFLNQIRILLFDFGIESSDLRIQHRYEDKVMIAFTIYQKQNFEDFEKFIGFTHAKKRNILRNMINSYVNKHQTKNNILQTIYSTTKPLTTKELAALNKIKPRTAEPHLRNLSDEGLINKIEGYRNKWLRIN